jgi:ABC-2 type transport system ATP-binding protein
MLTGAEDVVKLQVRRLEKVIENRTVLSIEQLDLDAGMIVAVIGPVGSGKSLLLRMLSGKIPPSGGCITLDQQDINKVPAMQRHIGILFEEDLLYERFTARGNLDFFAQLHHLPRERVSEALEQVGMSDQAQKRLNKLSPSAQRRLAFTRTLLPRPPILLLDQPTLRTDLDTQALFARLITQAAANGTAILLTDEDLSWAGRFCTHVVELEDGRVLSSYMQGADQKPALTVPERLIPYKVPARKDDRIVLYDPGDLLYATSRDGKTILRTATEEATTNLTLQELEGRLTGRGFFKAHRAYLVNLQHIKAIIQFTRNSYTLQLDDSQETMIPLSKQSEKELQALLDY